MIPSTSVPGVGGKPPRIAYFVHDINDAAVARRVEMLTAAGATVSVAGFRRDERVPKEVAGAIVHDLGRTKDADLAQRARAVGVHLMRPATIMRVAAGADIVIGRNLESLALAARARPAAPGARLVYECLDIHRSLLGASLPARAIQHVEGQLLGAIDLLIVSSPAFLTAYFARRASLTAPTLLVENKLLCLGRPAIERRGAPVGPPWTIGWFGNLRCKRTFDVLSTLAATLDGQVEVLIAGRPSPAVFDDFDSLVAAAPHIDYAGPYRADDLAALYGRCHFAWSVDFFEEGLNSEWLLPNKLYEAGSFGVVPIALRSVETGRWLARHGAGLLLDHADPVAQLAALFRSLSGTDYSAMQTAIEAIDRRDLVADRSDCDALLAAVVGS